MFHLIRAGAVYEIWAVRPISETTAYAMKWLPPGRKYTRHAATELRHEFHVGKSLQHPSVIKTYEFGTTDNGAYLLLELFKVPNLKQHILTNYRRMHPFAREILSQMAAGLVHMHEKGWVHRDVKPDNFLLDQSHHVKLIDFNLSRKRSGMLGKIFGSRGKVQGTYSYIAPEQIRGGPSDPSADIYSLGCVIYEFLAGKPPFTANTPAELLQRHIRSKPPMLTVADKNITPEFAAFVARMMAKEPRERPAHMKDVLMELKAEKIFYQPPTPQPDEESSVASEDTD